MIDEEINLEFLPSDFEHDFADPEDCPFATALKRNGYCEVNAGTLDVRARKRKREFYIKVGGVYLNGQRIDNPAFGFTLHEYRRVKEELLNSPATSAFLSLTITENRQDL